MATSDQLRKSLEKACSDAQAVFFSQTVAKSREEYFAKGKLGDSGVGAVYGYFDKSGSALYVGETSRPIKRRMHDETSRHKEAVWWKYWESVRFMQLNNRTDRLTLELLLILALSPKCNTKPGTRDLAKMFESESL